MVTRTENDPLISPSQWYFHWTLSLRKICTPLASLRRFSTHTHGVSMVRANDWKTNKCEKMIYLLLKCFFSLLPPDSPGVSECLEAGTRRQPSAWRRPIGSSSSQRLRKKLQTYLLNTYFGNITQFLQVTPKLVFPSRSVITGMLGSRANLGRKHPQFVNCRT